MEKNPFEEHIDEIILETENTDAALDGITGLTEQAFSASNDELRNSNSSVRNLAKAFETLVVPDDPNARRRQISNESASSATINTSVSPKVRSTMVSSQFSSPVGPDSKMSLCARSVSPVATSSNTTKALYQQNPNLNPFADGVLSDDNSSHERSGDDSSNYSDSSDIIQISQQPLTTSPQTKPFTLSNSRLTDQEHTSLPFLFGSNNATNNSSSPLNHSVPVAVLSPPIFSRPIGSPDRPAPPSRSSRAVSNRSPIISSASVAQGISDITSATASYQSQDSLSGLIPSATVSERRSINRGQSEQISLGFSKPPLPPRPINSQAISPDRGLGLVGTQQSMQQLQGAPQLFSPSQMGIPPPLPTRPSARRANMSLESSMSTPCFSEIIGPPTTNFATLNRYASLMTKEFIYDPITRIVNRSLPIAPRFPSDGVHHKGPVNTFTFSGLHAATGYVSCRLWDIPTATNSHFYTPATDQKPHFFAVCFIPSRQISLDNTVIWASIERGELIEMDVATGKLLDRRIIHNATVTHIIRHRFTVYTLDDNGGFKIWTAGNDGRVDLASRPRGLRVSAKQTSMLVDTVDGIDRLWTVSGKQIEVFNLEVDALALVERKISLSTSVGPISAITSLPAKRMVFTGHEDGKITVFDSLLLVKLWTVQVALYRISSLVGVGKSFIWAGFGTGKIAVYDVAFQSSEQGTAGVNANAAQPSGQSWAIVKEFAAYSNAGVTHLAVDDSSLAFDGQLLVGSVSESGHMRFWDGMLDQYRQEMAMRSLEAKYCDYNPVNIVILTWNIDARKPNDMDLSGDVEDNRFLRNLFSVNADANMFIFGFQELVDLESKSETAKQLFKGAGSSQTAMDQRQKLWQDRLSTGLAEAFPDEPYTMVECRQLVGLFQCVFVQTSLAIMLSDVSVSMVKTGLGGFHGNKGSIATRFLWQDTSFCFINCHLAAHQGQTSARNNDIAHIFKETSFPKRAGDGIWMRGGDGSMIVDHEAIFWSGDFNYRIDLSRTTVFEKIGKQDWQALWVSYIFKFPWLCESLPTTLFLFYHCAHLQEHDQLKRQKAENASFGLRDFDESALSFAPTFKYKRGTQQYDSSEKMRIPAYCDRILTRGTHISHTFYSRGECKISDHRPIIGGFRTMVKLINTKRRSQHLANVRAELDAQLLIDVQMAKTEWVMAVKGVGSEDARVLLDHCNWNLQLV
ncbi:hypothetical protein QVD99_001312 [Batrachochytrium dendrobatidis]|nr:hypothetical protein QVD99_001312 [Batrachochytrium dendrobatidis]